MCDKRNAIEKDGFFGPYNVFPFNIYKGKVTYPPPYYSYDPRGVGQQLLSGNEVPNPHTMFYYGYNDYPNGYGEGNLQGHVCECVCSEVSNYGKIKNPVNKCWCPRCS